MEPLSEKPERPLGFNACPLCEAPVPEGVRFCPQCGLSLGPPARRRSARWPWLVALGVTGLVLLLIAAWSLGGGPQHWQVAQAEREAYLNRQALERDPNNPLLRNKQAVLTEKLERLYRQALERDPDHPLLLNNLAWLYADTLEKNLKEAEKMAERAVQRAPDQSAFWDTLGWVYFKLGKYEKAVAPLVRGAQLDPREAACPYHLGAVYEALKQPDQARQAYRQAMALGGEYGSQARKALKRLEESPGTRTHGRSRP